MKELFGVADCSADHVETWKLLTNKQPKSYFELNALGDDTRNRVVRKPLLSDPGL